MQKKEEENRIQINTVAARSMWNLAATVFNTRVIYRLQTTGYAGEIKKALASRKNPPSYNDYGPPTKNQNTRRISKWTSKL